MPDLSALVALVLVAATQAAPAPPSPLPATPAPAARVRTAPADHAVWPLQPAGGAPEVAAGFDPPGSTYGAGHRGVDLLGQADEAVHAALGGTVSFAGTIAGRGVVVIDHGGTRTTYEPVAALVHRGETVLTSSVLGTLQSGASHCPPRTCLHWGLIAGEEYLDPLSLLGAGPVRLLPLD